MKQYSFLKEEFDIRKITSNKTIRKSSLGLIGAKAASISAINAVITKKIFEIREKISKCETREQAERILLDVGYVLKRDGSKQVRIASINYAISDAVVGPAIQIVKNETDPNWKQNVLRYLKYMTGISGLRSIFALVGGAAALKTAVK